MSNIYRDGNPPKFLVGFGFLWKSTKKRIADCELRILAIFLKVFDQKLKDSVKKKEYNIFFGGYMSATF